MVGEEDNGSNLDGLDVDDDIEIKVAKVEIGDNHTIVSNELENGNGFFAISHYIGAWKISTMARGICGIKVT